MNKYKAIIFDLDGVICHTDKYHYLAWKKMADGKGIYFDETINNRLRGVSRMESLDIILERYDQELTGEEKLLMATEKNDLYKELLMEMTTADLSPEVRTTLDTLKSKGFILTIGSSSKNTPLILNRLGLQNFFDAISDGNNIENSKPDPEVFLKAADFVGLTPADCVVVEDAFAGIEAAQRGGFDCIGMGDAVKAPGATYTIESFKEIIDCVTK